MIKPLATPLKSTTKHKLSNLSDHMNVSMDKLSGCVNLAFLPIEKICDAFCDFGACGGTTSSAENATLNDVNKFLWRRTLFVKRIPATFNK